MKKSIITIAKIFLIITSVKALAVDINITKNLTSITAKERGDTVIIKRVQKSNSELNHEFMNISQECPPYCIQPINIGNVKTVGELEVLNFIKEMKDNSNTLLIDARSRDWAKKGTIPTAINLPFTMLQKNGKYIEKILKLLGGTKTEKKWNFYDAQTLLIFSNGAWDEDATTEIKNLVEMGYPEDKILYYRGGMQMWNYVGLTIK